MCVPLSNFEQDCGKKEPNTFPSNMKVTGLSIFGMLDVLNRRIINVMLISCVHTFPRQRERAKIIWRGGRAIIRLLVGITGPHNVRITVWQEAEQGIHASNEEGIPRKRETVNLETRIHLPPSRLSLSLLSRLTFQTQSFLIFPCAPRDRVIRPESNLQTLSENVVWIRWPSRSSTLGPPNSSSEMPIHSIPLLWPGCWYQLVGGYS